MDGSTAVETLERSYWSIRVMPSHKDAIIAVAEAEGIPIGEYIERLVADDMKKRGKPLPVAPAPVPTATDRIVGYVRTARGRVTPAELARELDISRGTVDATLSHAVAKGLVARVDVGLYGPPAAAKRSKRVKAAK